MGTKPNVVAEGSGKLEIHDTQEPTEIASELLLISSTASTGCPLNAARYESPQSSRCSQ